MPDTSAPPAAPPSEEPESSLSLDVITGILLRRWYWILLFALAGGGAAYYMTGKQNYIFEKTASVLMRESSKESSSDRIKVDLGMDSGAANLANESFILRSSTVMRSTVEDLALNVSYWKQQDLRQIDLYRDSPITVTFDGIAENRFCSVDVTLQEGNSLVLTYHDINGNPVQEKGTFHTPIHLPFATVTVYPTSNMTEAVPGTTITVRRTPVNAAADQLLANFTVMRPDAKESSILQMTLTSTNPAKAADTLNKLIAVYNDHSTAERRTTAVKTKDFIREQRAQVGADLKQVDQKMDDIKIKNDIIADTEASISADFNAAQTLDNSIFELQTQMKLADGLKESLNALDQKAGLISLDTGIADSGVSRQIEAYNTAYLEYQKVAGSAGGQNPIVVTLTKKMDATRSAAARSLDNLRNNQKLQLEELTKKRENIGKRLTATSGKARELTPLDREHRVKEELYLTLLSKELENDLTLALTESSARVLEAAHGPDSPIAPNTRKSVLTAAAGGAIACILGFLGLALLNNKIKNRKDLNAVTHLPVVAELPAMTKKEQRNVTRMFTDEHSVISEYFQILCHNADSMLPVTRNQGHVILLTSTMQGEGKTFISANLALAFANIGKRVLVVDGDLRKASLSKQLDGKGRKGLSTILLRKVEDPFSVIRTLPEHAGVDILYAGPQVPNPVTLLSLPELEELIRLFRERYDAVIIDSPPYGILADTAILASHANISLYVIRSNRIDKRHISTVQQLADSGQLPNLGFIINAVDFKASSYSYYGYGYHYGNTSKNTHS
ncbi:tyrosine-protein kinase [Akkermansia sp.]|uniref:GumC family protein n=1 Tax=Akkermansia sp. TaxID=1872421 RepID=UPI0025C4C3E5|nr:tyrosine-protein kinase [Akkermansia sp.]